MIQLKAKNTKHLTQAEIKTALIKIDTIVAEFRQELARLKKERIQIIDKINRKADDKKIQEILKRIK
ncbi:MAG: hypothetical protein WC517_01660 [Patescibacteria group bacterium]